MRIAVTLLMCALPLMANAADHPEDLPQTRQPREALPFISDDYPRALAEARARKVPLFVDGWTTWCHTCRFMRAYVFTDASLARQAKRFVWLSIDAEKPENAAFLAKFPITSYPTLMVIDPVREAAALSWAGSANPAQLTKLLDDGERAVRGGGEAGVQARARADRLAGERKWQAAANAYREALPLLPEAERPRLVESWVTALSLAHDDEACAQTAAAQAPRLPPGPSFANAVSVGLTCALELKAADGAQLRAALAPLGEQAVALPGLLADDRSSLFESLVQLHAEAGDVGGKRAVAQRWWDFLSGEAARAPGPEQRAAFDPHRVGAALAMDEPLRAEALLKASERDLPGDYNPPARLALVYRAAKRYDDALAAIDRALAKAYGPRALGFYDLKAELQKAKGDRDAARKTLQTALQVAAALPEAQRPAGRVAMLQKKLDELR